MSDNVFELIDVTFGALSGIALYQELYSCSTPSISSPVTVVGVCLHFAQLGVIRLSMQSDRIRTAKYCITSMSGGRSRHSIHCTPQSSPMQGISNQTAVIKPKQSFHQRITLLILHRRLHRHLFPVHICKSGLIKKLEMKALCEIPGCAPFLGSRDVPLQSSVRSSHIK